MLTRQAITDFIINGICANIPSQFMNTSTVSTGAIGDYGMHKVKTILCFTIEGKEIKNLRVVEFPRK